MHRPNCLYDIRTMSLFWTQIIIGEYNTIELILSFICTQLVYNFVVVVYVWMWITARAYQMPQLKIHNCITTGNAGFLRHALASNLDWKLYCPLLAIYYDPDLKPM